MTPIERLKEEKNILEQRLKEVSLVLRDLQSLEERALRILAARPQNRVSTTADAPAFGSTDLTRLLSDDATAPFTESADTPQDTRRRVSDDVRAFELVARSILATATRPLDRHALLEAVVGYGHLVPGADPLNTLGARMSRMPGVINVKKPAGRGYWLEERINELDNL